MSDVIARSVLELTTDNSKLDKGLSAAEARVKSFEGGIAGIGQRLTSFGKSATSLGTALTTGVTAPVVGLLGTLGALAVSSAKTGDDIAKAAREAGLGAKSYQELTFAIGQVAKVSDEELTKGFGKLSILIADAANGSKPAIAALEKLGFSQQQIASGSITTEQAITAMTAAMQNAASPAQAIALAGDLVGDRLGPKLAGALREGGAEVERLRGEFNTLGLGMSGEALAASEKFNDQLDVVTRQFGALGREIGSALLPLITDSLIPAFQNHIVPALKTVSEWLGTATKWFAELPAPVQTGALAVAGLAAAVGPLLVAIGAVAGAIGAALPVIATIGGALATLATGPIGLVVAAVAGLTLAWTVWGDDIKGIVGTAYMTVKDFLVDKFDAIWTGAGKAIETFTGLWTKAKDTIVGLAGAVFEGVKLSMTNMIRLALLPVTAPIEGVLLVFRNWSEITRIAENVYLGVKRWMLDQFNAVVDRIKGAVGSVTGAFKSMYDAVVGNSFVPDLIERIGIEFDKLDDVMVRPVRETTGEAGRKFSGLLSLVEDKFSVTNLRRVITNPMETIKGEFIGIWERAKTDLGGTLDGILDVFNVDFLGGLDKMFGSWAPTISSLLFNIGDLTGKNFIKAFAEAAFGVPFISWIEKWTGGDAPRWSFDPEHPSGGGPDPHNPNNPYVDEEGNPYQPGQPEEGQNSFDRGTRRLDFHPFSWGQPIRAHGMEAIIPRGGGHLLAREIAAALPQQPVSRSVVVNLDLRGSVVPDRNSLVRFAEQLMEPMMTVARDRGFAT